MNSLEHLKQKWVTACIDGSTISNAVVDYAAWIAHRVNAPLQLVHSVEHSSAHDAHDHTGNLTPNQQDTLLKQFTAEDQARSKTLIQQGKQILADAQQRVIQRELNEKEVVREVVSKQRHGDLATTLRDLENEIRVLVVGIRGQQHNTDDEAIGNQLENAIRALHQPIFIVNGAFKQPTSVMLAYNDTPGAKKALQMVCTSPLYKNMHIHVVHASKKSAEAESAEKDQHDKKTQALLKHAAQSLFEAGIDAHTAHLIGEPQDALLAYQEQHNIDLTVMGAFNHGKLHQLFFGSFTLKMLKHNHKPILLLR